MPYPPTFGLRTPFFKLYSVLDIAVGDHELLTLNISKLRPSLVSRSAILMGIFLVTRASAR